MLQHNVMLTLVDDATQADQDAIVTGLIELPEQVPGLASIEVQSDAGLAQNNAHILFTMSFVDESSWRAYTSHPAHEALAARYIRPVLVTKTALQYLA